MYHFIPKVRVEAGGRDGAGAKLSARLIADDKGVRIIREAAVCGK
jgi:hypothetical protein